MQHAEIQMSGMRVGVDREAAHEGGLGELFAARAVQGDAEMKPCIRVTGVARQNLLVRSDRGREIALLLRLHRREQRGPHILSR